jgi:hypothetical protein
MKKQILKSIFLFYLLSSIFYLQKTDAQIVYTDINPDKTITLRSPHIIKTYGLDLNNDGINDFTLNAGRGGSWYTQYVYVSISGLNDNEIEVADSLSVFPGYPLELSKNTIITGQEAFDGGGSLLWKNISLTKGYWEYNKTRYLGIKLIKDGFSFYGWIKLSVFDNGPSATLKAYAYNSIPNQPILAGETSCGTPTVTLNANGPLSFYAGDSVALTANGTGYQYQWKKNGANISGAISQTYIAKTAGTYKCKVTNSCGSMVSTGKIVIVPCRMTNENFAETSEHLFVFPNPANNSVTIKFPSNNTEPDEVQIINLFGEILFSEKIIAEQTQIDVSKFSIGIYVVRWNSRENSETKTFSIVK